MHYNRNSESFNNILKAFENESAEYVRYKILEDDARRRNNEDLAVLYGEFAGEELCHARIWYREAHSENEGDELAESIAGETDSAAFRYNGMASKAELEGYEALSDKFLANGKSEAMHRDKLLKYKNDMDGDSRYHSHEETLWVCRKCGYSHAGLTPPEECPLCGYGKTGYRRADM